MPSFRRVVAGAGRGLGQRAGPGPRAGRRAGRRRAQGAAPGRGPDEEAVAAAVRGGGAVPRLAGPPEAALDTEALVERVVDGLGAGFDPEWGGFGPAPEVPPARPSSSCACAGPPWRPRRRRTPGTWRLRTLDAMAAGGHLRPPRRRVLPLLHRRALAGPPLREDAHRPGPAGPGLPARLAGHRAGGVSRRGHRDPRLRPARPLDPRGRALLVLRRRRRRGRGRARDLHPRRAAPAAPRRPRGAGGRVVRDHARRELGGPLHSRSAPSARRWSARPRSRRPASCSPPPGPGGSSRPGTRRC